MGKKWELPEQPTPPPKGERFPKHDGEVEELEFECDYCEKDLEPGSRRYRCGKCEDFDVCHKCYSKRKGTSKEHKHYLWYMGLVAKPKQRKRKRAPSTDSSSSSSEHVKRRKRSSKKKPKASPKPTSPKPKAPVKTSKSPAATEAKSPKAKPAVAKPKVSPLKNQEAKKSPAASREKSPKVNPSPAVQPKPSPLAKPIKSPTKPHAAQPKVSPLTIPAADPKPPARVQFKEPIKRPEKPNNESQAKRQKVESLNKAKVEQKNKVAEEVDNAKIEKKKEKEAEKAKSAEEKKGKEVEEKRGGYEEKKEKEAEARRAAEEKAKNAEEKKKKEEEKKRFEEKKEKESEETRRAAEKKRKETEEKKGKTEEENKKADGKAATPKARTNDAIVAKPPPAENVIHPLDEVVEWLYTKYVSSQVKSNVLKPHKMSDELDFRMASAETTSDFAKIHVGKKLVRHNLCNILNLSWWGHGGEPITSVEWAPTPSPVLAVLTSNISDKEHGYSAAQHALLVKVDKAGTSSATIEAVEAYRPNVGHHGRMTSFAWLDKQLEGVAGLAACIVRKKEGRSQKVRSNVCVMKLPMPSRGFQGDGVYCNELAYVGSNLSGTMLEVKWVQSDTDCLVAVSGIDNANSVVHLLKIGKTKLHPSSVIKPSAQYTTFAHKFISLPNIALPVVLTMGFRVEEKAMTYSVWAGDEAKEISSSAVPEISVVTWPAGVGNPIAGTVHGEIGFVTPIGFKYIAQSPAAYLTAGTSLHVTGIHLSNVNGRSIVWSTAGGMVFETRLAIDEACLSCTGEWSQAGCVCPVDNVETKTVKWLQGSEGCARAWMKNTIPLSLRGGSSGGLCTRCLAPEESSYCQHSGYPHGTKVLTKNIEKANAKVEEALKDLLSPEFSGQYSLDVPQAADGLALGEAIHSLQNAPSDQSLLAAKDGLYAYTDQPSGAMLVSLAA